MKQHGAEKNSKDIFHSVIKDNKRKPCSLELKMTDDQETASTIISLPLASSLDRKRRYISFKDENEPQVWGCAICWVQFALLWGFETDIEDIALMLIYSCYLKLGIDANLYIEVYDYKHTSCIILPYLQASHICREYKYMLHIWADLPPQHPLSPWHRSFKWGYLSSCCCWPWSSSSG